MVVDSGGDDRGERRHKQRNKLKGNPSWLMDEAKRENREWKMRSGEGWERRVK